MAFQPCFLYPDDNYLVFVKKNSNGSVEVMHSVSYKNIMEIELISPSSKYSIAASNTLQIKCVNDTSHYERHVLERWTNPYQALEAGKLRVLQLKFLGGEQQAIDFQHQYMENKR